MQTASVGRIVHYRSHGTPGGEYAPECRAAIVTEVSPESNAKGGNFVGLSVFNPTGIFLNQAVEYDDGAETAGHADCPQKTSHGDPFRYCACGWAEPHYTGGTWHWPEQV